MKKESIIPGHCFLIKGYFDKATTIELSHAINQDADWQHQKTRYGKHLVRAIEYYGTVAYAYSSTYHHDAKPMTPIVRQLAEKLSHVTPDNQAFNAVLLNKYNERANIGTHADDEKENDGNILSLSLGATRTFILSENKTGKEIEILLEDGDLLWMSKELQETHKHRISRAKVTKGDQKGTRINLTFRTMAE